MHDIIHPQIQLGALGIGSIKLDLKSCDEIPQILLGPSSTSTQRQRFASRSSPFSKRSCLKALSKARMRKPIHTNSGRPGMAQWTILVLGILRLGLNADYDHIQELANQHNTIRKMLGHSD